MTSNAANQAWDEARLVQIAKGRAEIDRLRKALEYIVSYAHDIESNRGELHGSDADHFVEVARAALNGQTTNTP